MMKVRSNGRRWLSRKLRNKFGIIVAELVDYSKELKLRNSS